MANGRISLEQALNSDNFYQLPKVIIGTKYYRKLKAEAKLLFMLCRDRLSASLDRTRKGDMRFVDDEGDVFIYYVVDDLAKDLGCGKAKVIRLKKELIKYGLIDEVRQGLNKANRIYVKNVITDINILNMEFEEAQDLLDPVKSTEVPKSNSSNTKVSKTKKSDIKYTSFDDDEEGLRSPFEKIESKIEKVTPYDKEYIYGLVHDGLRQNGFSEVAADFAMVLFDDRYQYALEHMKFARSAEMVAEYVFNGIVAEWNQRVRRDQEKGAG